MSANKSYNLYNDYSNRLITQNTDDKANNHVGYLVGVYGNHYIAFV